MAKKKPISEFMAREMLYDYVLGQLESHRREAFEDCLKESEEVRDELKNLQTALKYSENIRKIQVTQPLLDKLSQPPLKFKDYLAKWKTVRAPIRHSVEATIIAFLLSVGILLMPKKFRPWEKEIKYSVVEVERSVETEVPVAEETPLVTTTLVIAATDVTYGPPTTLKVEPEKALKLTEMPMALLKKFEAKPKETPEPETPKAAPEAKTAGVRKGEIYRGFMTSDQVDQWSPQFVEKIQALGGEKAGEVQLGWRRQQGSYFHFSLPESNYEQLLSYLQSFGPVRIVKESHPRVMPEGKIRIILWLETAAGKGIDGKGQQPQSGDN